jgi:hypothetical protein
MNGKGLSEDSPLIVSAPSFVVDHIDSSGRLAQSAHTQWRMIKVPLARRFAYIQFVVFKKRRILRRPCQQFSPEQIERSFERSDVTGSYFVSKSNKKMEKILV